MTKKNYIAIAASLKTSRADVAGFNLNANVSEVNEIFYHVADNIAAVMAADNPLFDRERFLLACDLVKE